MRTQTAIGQSKQPMILRLMMMIIIGALAVGSFSVAQAAAGKKKQAKKEATATAQQSEQEEEASMTVWTIIEMTSWLFWPFVFVTASGLMLLSYRGLREYQEDVRARALLREKIEARDIRRLVRKIQDSKPNRASRLMYQIVATFNKTNRAEPISADITQFINSERESYETFNRLISFFSDTAGALGLLGTVWGIFETFHGGKLDGPTILMGMSVSLVTTLVGLIISIVLNMGGTGIFAMFNRHLRTLGDRAEELRQALLHLETRSNGGRAGAVARSANEMPAEARRKPAAAARRPQQRPAEMPPYEEAPAVPAANGHRQEKGPIVVNTENNPWA